MHELTPEQQSELFRLAKENDERFLLMQEETAAIDWSKISCKHEEDPSRWRCLPTYRKDANGCWETYYYFEVVETPWLDYMSEFIEEHFPDLIISPPPSPPPQ